MKTKLDRFLFYLSIDENIMLSADIRNLHTLANKEIAEIHCRIGAEHSLLSGITFSVEIRNVIPDNLY